MCNLVRLSPTQIRATIYPIKRASLVNSRHLMNHTDTAGSGREICNIGSALFEGICRGMEYFCALLYAQIGFCFGDQFEQNV